VTGFYLPAALLLPLLAQVRAFHHAFSTNDCSRNVYIKKNGFTLHRNPIAQSTDGARTKIGFSEGRHAWEVWWEGPLGTVAVIGIATKRAAMQCQGYVALLGSDDQSWGWNLVDNNLLHNGEVNGSFPQCNNAPKYQVRGAWRGLEAPPCLTVAGRQEPLPVRVLAVC